MKAAVIDRLGEPREVLRAADVPGPEPKAGEVLVRMIASPINPSDLMTVRGQYVSRPPLPFTPGYEGVGVVEASGGGLLGGAMKGRRVAVLNQAGGNWAEYTVVPANRVIPVSDRLPDVQVASFFVNPATVLAMVRHVLKVPKGGWLLQSAAGSTLGKMIIRLGRHDGFRTLNVVRRKEAVDELKELGGDAVISTSEGLIAEQVRAIVGQDGVRHAVDPVAGETGGGIFDALAIDGRMLVYGTLSGERIPVDPRPLIGGKRVEGFYLGLFMERRPLPSNIAMFFEISRLIQAGVLATEVGRSFPLDRVAEAAAESEASGRGGKVTLQIGTR